VNFIFGPDLTPGRPDAGQTNIREVMRLPMGRLGRAVLAVIGKFPAEEVCANLRRLQQVIETGRSPTEASP